MVRVNVALFKQMPDMNNNSSWHETAKTEAWWLCKSPVGTSAQHISWYSKYSIRQVLTVRFCESHARADTPAVNIPYARKECWESDTGDFGSCVRFWRYSCRGDSRTVRHMAFRFWSNHFAGNYRATDTSGHKQRRKERNIRPFGLCTKNRGLTLDF